jgi:phage I-like protein
MAFGSLWGKKDSELPEALRGLTPEQLVEQLASGKAAQDRLTALEPEVSTLKSEAARVPALQNQFTELQSRLTAIEAGPASKTSVTPTNTVPSVLEDEDGAFNARLKPFANALMAQAAQNARQLAHMTLGRDPKKRYVLDKWGAEVDRLFATVPVHQQGNEASYLNCFKIVVADHMDELSLEQAKKDGAFSVEGGGNGTSTPQNQVLGSKADSLSDDEKRTAKKFGMSDEDFLKTRKGLVFQNAG